MLNDVMLAVMNVKCCFAECYMLNDAMLSVMHVKCCYAECNAC